MKKILSFITILIFFACSDPVVIDSADMSGTISASDQRNVMLNSFIDAYENKDKAKALSIFAENAVFHVNDTKLTPAEVIDAFMKGHEYFDDIKNIDRNTTTMFYNSGDIYTNYWYTWNGTNKKNGELLAARGYAWFKWDGLKVIEAYNAFDPTEYNKAFE
mgnify:FL=1|tara:strand:+ start:374 stop:856 length:483 start_codon:yes stop_codon:yes gene_type:complete